MMALPLQLKQLGITQSQTVQILSHPTWDIILLFVLIAGGFFYGISFGRQRVVNNILYTYAAYGVTVALPLDALLSAAQMGTLFFAKGIIFLVFFIVFIVALGGKRRRWGLGASGAWWQTFILSILQVGLLMHFLFQFLPKTEVLKLAPMTRSAFANPMLHIWWVILPIAVLIIFKTIDFRDDY